MDWDVIRRLAGDGDQFGSHTCSRRPLSALSVADMIHEGEAARRLLRSVSGPDPPVAAIAYPYGDVDGVVARVMGRFGYRVGLTCRPGEAACSIHRSCFPDRSGGRR